MNGLRGREAYEKEERERLAPYAVASAESRGRPVSEPPHAYRTAFQRDRDRVLHARAFRRLEYKTQVFIQHEGDHYRNRLTHTLEVAQIARTVARVLRLNEDLVEAIALAHDLGHTPFAHAGERALRRLLRDAGGFEHNRQGLRVVDLLEERYPRFRGLNLTHETREGILKHGGGFRHPVALPPATSQPSLEAQIVDLADEVAYTNHDLDDGLRAGLITREQLEDEPLWREAHARVLRELRDPPERVARAQTILVLIDALATDLAEATAERVEAAGVRTLEAVRSAPERLAGLSGPMAAGFAGLKRFLSRNLYRHDRVLRMSRKAERVVAELFGVYRDDPAQLPPEALANCAVDGEHRAVADYIAGMTDRFALAEHRKLLDPHEPV